MAEKVTVVNNFRAGVAGTVENMRAVGALLANIEDHGVDDAARLAFLAGTFGEGNPHPDITEAEFAEGNVALSALRTAWDVNKYAVAKLLK